jgi:hypothetical protein
MAVEKVVEILNARVREGMGKRGEWSMAEVLTSEGKTVSVFNPVAVGQDLEVTFNSKFSKFDGKVLGGGSSSQGGAPVSESKGLLDVLRAMNEKLDKILQHQELQSGAKTAFAETPKTAAPTDNVNLDDLIG